MKLSEIGRREFLRVAGVLTILGLDCGESQSRECSSAYVCLVLHSWAAPL